MRWFLIALIGCGRVGFSLRDEPPADAPSVEADAGPTSIAEIVPCASPLRLDSGGHNPHDTIRWVHDAVGDWLVGTNHYTQDDHKVERHALTIESNGLTSSDTVDVLAAADHIDTLSFEPVAGGIIMGYVDFVLGTGHTVSLGPGLVPTGGADLGPFAVGNPPLARIGAAGPLVMVGMTGSGLEMRAIDETGTPTGASLVVVNPADGAGQPTVTSIPNGVAVMWNSAAKSTCRVAIIDASLNIVAGPIDVGISGCGDPHAAWLSESQRLVVVGDDPSNGGGVFAAVYDATLNVVSAAHTLATPAHWARIAGDGDAAWITWAVLPSPQAVQYALVDSTATITRLGTQVGTLDDSLGHYHWIDRVATTTVILWVDSSANRTFEAERLCR
jgi:hypothetical protein